MATKNTFLQSPFDYALPETLPGQEPVKPQETPEIDTRKPVAKSGVMPPANLEPIFEAAAREFDVPVNVLMALGHQESRYNSTAIGQQTEWGRAKGMMQYLDSTAKNLGINPFSPEEAIPAAARQIRERLDKGYSMEDAVKEHFAGPDRKLWGPKTAAYGQEVMAKAGAIGDAFVAKSPKTLQEQLDAEEPGRYRVLGEEEANKLSFRLSENRDAELIRANGLPKAGDANGSPQVLPIDPSSQAPAAENKGFVSRNLDYLGADLKIGWNNLLNSVEGMRASEYGGLLESFKKKYTPEQIAANPALQAELKTREEGYARSMATIANRSAENQQLQAKMRPETRQFFSASDKPTMEQLAVIGDAVMKNPVGVITDLGVQSGPQSLAMVAAALFARLGGGGASTAANIGGGTSAALNFGSDYAELRKEGRDHEDAWKTAAAKASVVGAFDAVSMNSAGKALDAVLGKAGPIKKAGIVAKELGKQAGYGMAGEAGGSVASGREINPTDVAAEGLGELFGGPMEAVGTFRQGNKQPPPVSQPVSPGEALPPATTTSPTEPPQPPTEPPPAGPVPAAPRSTATGPLSRSIENAASDAAGQPPRVAITAPEGKITGFMESYVEDGQGGFSARVLGDDGQVYNFTNADPVTITPESPQAGPLTGAVQKTAEAVARQTPVQPTPDRPAPVAEIRLQDMSDDQLQGRLQFIANQAKASGGWNKMFVAERRRVEDEIQRRQQPTVDAAAPQEASQKFDPQGLQPGTPEYNAAFDAWSSKQAEQSDTAQKQNQRQENKKAIEKRNQWRKRVREWFLGAQDGDTITDTGTGQSYRVVVKQRKDGTTVKTLSAIDESGNLLSDGRAATGIAQVGERVDGLDDGSLDEDTGSAKPETEGQSLAASLGKMLEDGEAKTASAKPKKATKEDTDHLFGVDKKRATAIKRIEGGTAYFGTREKAEDFIKKNGLGDGYEVVQTGKVRFAVKPKGATDGDNQRADGQPNGAETMVGQQAGQQTEAATEAEAQEKITSQQPTPVDWKDAKPGDYVGADRYVVQRNIKTKKEAERIAGETGGSIAIDGPRTWAVLTQDRPDETGVNPDQNDVSNNRQKIDTSGQRVDAGDTSKSKRKEFTYAVKPTDGGFIIESDDGGGVVMAGRPTGFGILDTTSPRVFKTEADARAYMAKKGMAEANVTPKAGDILFDKDGTDYRIESNRIGEVTLTKNRDKLSERKVKMSSQEFERLLREDKEYRAGNYDELDAEMRSYEAKAEDKAEKIATTPPPAEKMPEPQWWTDSTPNERYRILQASGIRDTAQTNWNRLNSADQRALDEQWGKKQTGEVQPTATAAAVSNQFADNKIFTADKVEAARARLRSKLNQLNSGIDPEVLIDGMTIAGAYIESGVRKFGDYAKAMTDDFGEAVKPYLLSFYEAVRNYPGVQTEGMSSVDEARLAHADLMRSADAEQSKEAVGETVEKPAKRTKKTGQKSDMTLTQDWGVEHIDAYSDESEQVKDAFLKEAKSYLSTVAGILAGQGYTPYTDSRGRPEKAVSANESGVAGSGDVSLTLSGPDGLGVYMMVSGTSLRGVVPTTPSGISILFRVARDGDKSGVKDSNRWMPVDLSAADMAALIDKTIKAVATQPNKPTIKTQETTDNAGNLQPESVPAGDTGAAQADAAAGNRNSQQMDLGLAEDSEGADRDGQVSGRTQGAGTRRAGGSQQAGQQPSGQTRDRAGVRTEPQPADGNNDFVIDAEEIGKGGLAKKYRDNVAAIRILKVVEAEGRVATPEERKQLAKYVGWGAMKGPFDPENKQWAKQHEELKELLTDAEFRAARKSTLDAHYTSPIAVGAMYDAMTRLGFNGGRLLEPSVGVGNFFGLMPAAMRNASQLFGVELDSLTSRMVAALYPKAQIAKSIGFEDFQIPSEYFDAVIGNPPFGSQPLVDAERSPYSGFSIHNYFLAKSIDKLRQGGIMQVVVSHNFLDAQDSRARKWIAERADLIGGVRLPNTAFQENAGTQVVTDILVFRKREAGAAPKDLGWTNVGDQVNTNPKTGETATHKVNQFFIANPQFVLGTPSAGGTMYAANEYTVEPNGDLKEQLAGWVKALPENVYAPVERKAEAVTNMAVPDGIKVGSFYVDASGQVMQRGEDVMGNKTATAWQPPNAKALERMTGLIALRDTLRTQMRLERSPDAIEAEIEANRKQLNTLYDGFRKQYGHINNQTNRRIFLDDTEAQLVQALEFDYDKGISKAVAEKESIEPREPSAAKADIFKRRVAFPPQDFLTVTTAKDALLASLNYRGRVDTAYMAEVYGKPADEIVAELGDVVFDDPQAGIVMADEYLSGDVKTKLAEAKAAGPKYQRNVDALEKVIPVDKKPSEISVSIGAAFVPADVYEQFVKHISGGDAKAVYVKATGQWVLSFSGSTEPALNVGKFGTDKLSAQDLFQLSMLGRGAVVKQTLRNADGSTTTIVLEKETESAREKQNAIKSEWQSWLWSDPARADLIASTYNDKMNRIVERKYDGSHMTFPGMNPAISLLAHQKNGVWRGLQSRQVLYDQVVGAGKTFEMATLAMEMRRLGIARKPLFVVPNHLTLQWRSEFTRLYPGSNILAATPEDFSKDNRERLFSKIITGDWDSVIIGHSSLKKIGLPEETEKAVLQEQIDEVSQAVEDMKRARGDRNIIRDMEGIRARLEARMKDKLAAIGKRSKVVTFDELGIDAMFIDEMHEFKNLAYNSTMDRVPGMGNPNGSAKAFDLFVKTRWLFDTFGEKTPYVTATGTPVSNSLVEMYNMQRYMQYPTLKAQGLHVFDAWARQFAKTEHVYEVTSSGVGYRQSTRFGPFANLPGLMGLYNSFADTITLDDLKAQEEAQGKRFPVPKIVGGRPQNVVAKRSPAVANLMGVPIAQTNADGSIKFLADLNAAITIEQDQKSGKWVASVGDSYLGQFETEQDARLKVVERAITPEVSVDPESILGRFANLRQLTKETKGKVNALSLTGEANKAGLDYRLINPSAPDFAGSKINLAVDNMVKIYNQWKADKGTQLVFCDLSIPLSARATYASKARRLYVLDDAGAVDMKRGTMHTLEGYESLPYFIVQRGEKDTRRFDVYDAASGVLVSKDARSKQDARDAANALLADDARRQDWINRREASGEISQEQIDEYNNDNDIEADGIESFTREDIAGVSGASKFSVYDDIKAKLIAKGVPEREIAFIHDYATPAAKDKLFKAVNSGEIRFLLGSTPKMGAGTNVQKRVVGLHHIDAPWRPSDLEQREGRIIRRGNELYERDPDGFEVFIGRYATEQTYDTRRWQILEHKARGIEQLRNFDGTINEIDDIDGEAANAADMKAAASGDPLILEETRLKNDVRRLEQLQAAHADDVLSMNRKARDAQDFADNRGPRQLAEVNGLIETVKKNPVDKDGFAPITVDGKQYGDKEKAQKEIFDVMSLVRSNLRRDASIVYRGIEFTISMYGTTVTASSPTGNIGTWQAAEPFSSSGFVQRMANYANRLSALADSIKAGIEKSSRDAAALREEAKQPFSRAAELEATREEYKRVQRALLAKGPAVPESQKPAVAAGIEAQKDKLKAIGFGDALREFFANTQDETRYSVQPVEASDRNTLEAIFEGLEGRGKTRQRAIESLSSRADAETIRHLDEHFWDILGELEESKQVEIKC